ncbi:MAG: LPS export ABC transporter permease LptG [Candidatus Binatia bacterium]
MFSSFFPFPLISSYLCREFLRFFFLCLALFFGISLLVDLFDRLDDFIKYGASISAAMRYLVFKAPLLVTQAAPAAALAASLLSLGLLARHRELLALKACGISSWQIAWPLLLVAGLLSAGVWAWNETVVPYAFHQSRHINTVEIKKRTPKVLFHARGFWYHGENAFYHIDHFDSRRNILFGLTIYTLDRDFHVQSLIEVAQAHWQAGQWQLENIQEKPLSQENSHPPAAQEGRTWLRETPEDFALVDMEAEEFSSRQLRAQVANLQRKGLDTTEYQVDLQLKGAVPIATLVMTLLGIALALPGAKQFALSTTIGLALLTGFGYWVLLALTMSLGHSGALSPIPAAWSANSAAFLLGMFFLLGVD